MGSLSIVGCGLGWGLDQQEFLIKRGHAAPVGLGDLLLSVFILLTQTCNMLCRPCQSRLKMVMVPSFVLTDMVTLWRKSTISV